MGYVKFTEEERNRARETNLADFLEEHGETVKKSGSEFVWLNGEQKVTLRGNLFFHQYEQKGGDAIDFVRKFYGKNYVEAVQMLLGRNAEIQPIAKKEYHEHKQKDLKMPPKNNSMKRVFAYLLMTRGLIKVFCRNLSGRIWFMNRQITTMQCSWDTLFKLKKLA